jgi:Flp pilus assembly protein TadD
LPHMRASAREEDSVPARTIVDKLLVVGVVIATVAVVAILGMIAWSAFGPQPAPRTDAERLMQAGLAAVASDPTSSTAHMDLGAAYFETGQYDKAEKEFTTAQGLAKGSPVPLYNLAHVYRLTGRHAEAAEAFRQVVSKAGEAAKWRVLSKMFTDARYWLGVEYVTLKRPADAVQVLLPLTKSKPLDAEAARELARAYEATGDIDSAVTWYKAVLQVQPEDAGAAAGLQRLGK